MNEQAAIRDMLVRQYEYFQYLFEQEQKRAASIVSGAKVYIAFLIFIIGSIFLKVIAPGKIVALFSNSAMGSGVKFIGISLVMLAVAALLTVS